MQYSKLITNKLATNLSYRFYNDDWDITSHTIDTEFNYEINDKLNIGVGLRYYTQSESEFYSDKSDYFTTQKYLSSDRRVSDFDSINYKINTEYKVNSDITLNANINYYKQDDFDAIYFGVGAKYRF